MQYLNTMLWESFHDAVPLRNPYDTPMDPRINVTDEIWQRSKCDMLGISFESVCRQPYSSVGKLLSGFEPWEAEHIEGDGNCLFRCISKLITGSENSHLHLRSIISRFIASEGTRKLGWYFKTKQTTPCKYLTTQKLMNRESIWGTDVEIYAASAILDADVYVANNFYRTKESIIREVRWSLHRATDNPTAILYIQNYFDHYQPVVSMLNTNYKTYGTISDDVQTIE